MKVKLCGNTLTAIAMQLLDPQALSQLTWRFLFILKFCFDFSLSIHTAVVLVTFSVDFDHL